MKNSSKILFIFKDFTYSVLGLVLLNGTIQFLLYPYLERRLGEDAFGNVLTLLSVIAIMGTTFGSAANYSRMVCVTKDRKCEGDYNLFLLGVSGLSVLVSLLSVWWLGERNILYFLGFYLLMLATVLRYYGDVEFRISINYKRYCLYYAIISFGYILGVILYPVSKSWILAVLLGEGLAVIYVMTKGNIFKGKVWQKSEYYKENRLSMLFLSGTYLISNIILNADRLLIKGLVGSVEVTIFYVATLSGKLVALISTPLNSVIMSHLAKYKGKITGKVFSVICLGGLGASLVFEIGCVIFAQILVRILYGDIFTEVEPYLWVANLGQVFYFVSGILMVILLRFTKEKNQIIINLIYFVLFLAVAIPMTMKWKLWGTAWALVIVNLLKIFLIMLVGNISLREKNDR